MGLLSFIPDLKEFANLKTEIEWYEADSSHVLYLWKNENRDFVGVLGTEINEDFIMVRQIAVTPNGKKSRVVFFDAR